MYKRQWPWGLGRREFFVFSIRDIEVFKCNQTPISLWTQGACRPDSQVSDGLHQLNSLPVQHKCRKQRLPQPVTFVGIMLKLDCLKLGLHHLLGVAVQRVSQSFLEDYLNRTLYLLNSGGNWPLTANCWIRLDIIGTSIITAKISHFN